MRRTTFCLLSALATSLLGAGCSPAQAPDAPPGSTPADSATPSGTAPTAPTAPTTGATTPADNPTAPGTNIVVGTDSCSTDADCVPSTCCMPTACGAASKAPDCSAVRCRMDCSTPNTVCGGGCLCQAGKCAARLGTTTPQ